MPDSPPPSPPEPALPSDTQEVLAFLERIFRPDKVGSMAREYPHLYAPERMPMNLVSRQGGHIVNVVGIFPIAFYIQSSHPSHVLTVGGIGGVSTCPAHRGQGLMRAGLQAAFHRMNDHEYAFSALWGDRQRYGHFGYEDAGLEIRGIANRRNFDPGSSSPLLQWRPAHPERRDDMEQLARLDALRTVCPYRPPEKWSLLLQRLGFSAYLATSLTNPQTQAFLIGAHCPRNRHRPRITELGGDPTLWPSMVGAWLFEKSLQEADVYLQPDDAVDPSPITDRLTQMGAYANAMLKILSLPRTLEPYLGILEDRARECGITDLPPLHICAQEQPQNGALIQLASGRISLLPAPPADAPHRPQTTPSLALPERTLARFLFGPTLPTSARTTLAQSQALPWLLLLPLPFAIPEINRV